MTIALDVLFVLAGASIVVATLDSAIRTFVLPRGAASALTRFVFKVLRRAFDLIMRPIHTYEGRDRVMAFYAPIGLLLLPVCWLALVLVGFALILHAVSVEGWSTAFEASGSSLTTLGFVRPPGGVAISVAVVEAVVGLGLLALLIAYLPTIYTAFSRRERLVAQLEIRSGSPPSAVSVLVRAEAMQRFDLLDDYWSEWTGWFAELEETHTSLAILPFFRSPVPERSWITASGAILDAAALHNSVVDVAWSPQAGLCIRSGFLALRSVAAYFGVPFDPDPAPTDPISITREEFDDACRQLEAGGLALETDRDRAWRDFAGWRVNYDRVLVALAGLLMAPYAPWSSDRSLRFRVPVRVRRRPRAV